MALKLMKRLWFHSWKKKKWAKAKPNTIFLPTRSTKIQNGVWWYLTKLHVYSYFNLTIPPLGIHLTDTPPAICQKISIRLFSVHYPKHWPQNGDHSCQPETTYTYKHSRLVGKTTVHTHQGIPRSCRKC